MGLTVWLKDGHTIAVIPRLVDRFTAATGIDVRLEVVPEGQAHDQLLGGQARPDVVTVPYWYLDEMVQADILTPLDGECPDLDPVTAFEPAARQALMRGGQLLALPHTLTGGLLTYRRDLTEQLGLPCPDTVDRVLGFARILAEAGLVPHPFLARTSAEFSSFETYAGWASAHGAKLLPDAGPLDGSALQTVGPLLGLLREPAAAGLLDADYAHLGEVLCRGDAGMLLDTSAWGFFAEDPRRSQVAGRMAYTSVSGPAGPVQFLYAEGLGVTTWSSHRAEAMAFLAWRHSPAVVREEVAALGRLDLPRADLRSASWFHDEVERRGLGDYLAAVHRAWSEADLAHVALRADFVPRAREAMDHLRALLTAAHPPGGRG